MIKLTPMHPNIIHDSNIFAKFMRDGHVDKSSLFYLNFGLFAVILFLFSFCIT